MFLVENIFSRMGRRLGWAAGQNSMLLGPGKHLIPQCHVPRDALLAATIVGALKNPPTNKVLDGQAGMHHV